MCFKVKKKNLFFCQSFICTSNFHDFLFFHTTFLLPKVSATHAQLSMFAYIEMRDVINDRQCWKCNIAIIWCSAYSKYKRCVHVAILKSLILRPWIAVSVSFYLSFSPLLQSWRFFSCHEKKDKRTSFRVREKCDADIWFMRCFYIESQPTSEENSTALLGFEAHIQLYIVILVYNIVNF